MPLVLKEDNMPTPHHPPQAVRRALRKLGADIRDARIHRGLPREVVAERAFTTRQTLARAEKGDHAVSIGIYAAALHALGLLDGMSDVADIAHDSVGKAMAASAMPQRARIRKSKAGTSDGGSH